MRKAKLETLITRLKARDRSALAKAITLLESDHPFDKEDANYLLSRLSKKSSLRLAISGPPGVGKSTFINNLGQKLLSKDFSVAILSIDPSSDTTKGSILADKTRMPALIENDRVFIRPSPSRGNLGGIALATEQVIFLMESFGFDFVIIETLGVGQSETVVNYLSDYFLLLLQPGAGDELQAMKMGILEKCDFILVNKADGELKSFAKDTKNALHDLEINASKPLFIATVSAQEDLGIKDFLELLLSRFKSESAEERERSRLKKRTAFFEYAFSQILMARLMNCEKFIKNKDELLANKLYEKYPLSVAIEKLVDKIVIK